MNSHDAKVFGLPTLKSRGFDIEIWDITFATRPLALELGIERTIDFETRIFMDKQTFEQASRELNAETLIIRSCLVAESQVWKHRDIVRMLSSSLARLAAVNAQTLPNFSPQVRSKAHLKLSFQRLRRRRAWGSLSRKIIMEFRLGNFLFAGVRPLDWIWTGVDISVFSKILIGPETRISFIHEFDFDRVLENPTPTEKLPEYVLMIDQMGPAHPDYVWAEIKSQITLNEYRDLIAIALNGIESRLGLQIIVAAHPRAKPGELEKLYPGRQVIYGRTAQLIRSARLVVVADGSTSTHIAIGMERPLIFIKSKQLDTLGQKWNQLWSESLGVPVIDLDVGVFPDLKYGVDLVRYNSYFSSNIKFRNTPEVLFWEHVADQLCSVQAP